VSVDDDRAARQDIAEVLVRYATGIDRRDWDLFRTCFTDDVVAEYEGIDTWTGVDAITSFMELAHAEMGHTLHRLTNMAIDVRGDAATARSYVDGILMMPDGRTGTSAVGYYDDRLVRTADGWRIARRRFTGVRFDEIGTTAAGEL
jgi:3-phenylpropionate/cinnamic acid dioxygenase small subunit